MKRKYIYIILISLIVSVFFFHVRVFAVENYVSKLIDGDLLNKNPQNILDIVTSYCSAVISDSFEQNGFVYDAKQSAFVYLFCNNINKGQLSSLDISYFVRTNFKQLGFQDLSDDEATGDRCSPISNDCTFSYHIPKLFNAIITDYVNMKQANIYGLNAYIDSDADLVDQVNTFSDAFYGIKICSEGIRSYPKTCRTAKNYITNARNLLSDVWVFDVDVLLEMHQSKKDVSCLNMSSDIFYCGLFGDSSASLISFTNLVYNELFFYRLFVGYYLLEIQKTPGLLSKNTYNTSYSTIARQFSTQYNRSQEALSLTLRMMRDAYMAYPFHIGFLMYQEDLDGFGKLLAKITTPIYTLYDKLRNVQKPK